MCYSSSRKLKLHPILSDIMMKKLLVTYKARAA
jgi:hypothetical protein